MPTFTHRPGATSNDAFFPVSQREISVETADGVLLPATLFTGEGSKPAVLISAAAAVERRFYRAFAIHLVEQGARAALTYDYRGIGSLAKGPRAKQFRMKDWGVLDLPAALAALEKAAGKGEFVGVGHSFGGVSLGLCGVSETFKRYCMVASLNGYFRRTAAPLSVFARMTLAGVPVTHILGYIPPAVGLGTALAGSIFRDWARWCRTPDFFFSDQSVPESRRFADVRLKLLSIGVTDDPWGTPEAVAALTQHFSSAEIEQIWLGPDEAGTEVGHMGFFRREMRDTLWPLATDFLLDGRSAAEPS